MLIAKFDNKNIEKHIIKFEKKYNFKFPKQYRDFLLKYNGGETIKTKFKIGDLNSDVRGFYGLGNANEHYHYNFFERINTLNRYLKDNMIPISSNLLGDHIVMSINCEKSGEIFFYYHDRPKKYIILTDDFKMFVAKCESEKLGHIKTIEERIATATEKGHGAKIPKLMPHWQAEIDKFSKMVQEELILD